MKFSELKTGQLFRFDVEADSPVWYRRVDSAGEGLDPAACVEQRWSTLLYLSDFNTPVVIPDTKADYRSILEKWKSRKLCDVYEFENFPVEIVHALIEGFEYPDHSHEKISYLLDKYAPSVDAMFRREKEGKSFRVAIFPSEVVNSVNEVRYIHEIYGERSGDLQELLSATIPVDIYACLEFRRLLETKHKLVLNVIKRPTSRHEQDRIRILRDKGVLTS